MSTATQLVSQHPRLTIALFMWTLSCLATGLAGLLPAPTKDSSAQYVLCFKFANGFVGNLARARSTAVEMSPNWRDAIEKVLNERSQPPQ